MKCPNCNQEPMPKISFMIHLNYLKIKCRNCGATLHGNTMIRIFFHLAVFLVLFLGYSTYYPHSVFCLTERILIVLGAVLIYSIVSGLILWHLGTYYVQKLPEKEPEDEILEN